MHIAPVQTRITLDDLAAELLPAPVITAIDNLAIELWRNGSMNDQHRSSRPRAMPAPAPRVLPVVVLGEIVIQPLVFPDPLVIQIQEGASYRAMQHAMHGDGEVLLVFVAEPDLAGFRSSEPQGLPRVGVLARVREVSEHAAPTHRMLVEALSRADVLSRVAHAPFYRAACVPHPDSAAAAVNAEDLMQHVKYQVEDFVRRTGANSPYGPEFVRRMLAFVVSIDEPGRLADACAAGPMFSFQEQLALLETFDPLERLRAVQRKLSA